MKRCSRVPVGIALALLTLALPAHADDATREQLEPLSKSLDFLQIEHRFQPDGNALVFNAPTRRYGHPDDASLTIRAFPFTAATGGLRWYQLKAPGLYWIPGYGHPEAARRAILESADMLGTDVQFLYEAMSGLVSAQVAIPVPDGTLSAKLLGAYIELLVDAIDGLDPVLDRAGNFGLIDWPILDQGPKKPAGQLEPKADGAPSAPVSWAPWIESDIYSSTIIASDLVWTQFLKLNDEEREAEGRQLTRFGGNAGMRTYASWMRIANHVEQRFPPIAFRFWGAPDTEVTATAKVPGFCESASAKGTIDSMGIWDVEITPQWNLEALAQIKQPIMTQVEFTVGCAGAQASSSQKVTIHPPSIADTGLGFLTVPQFVNEDHPWVRSLISEAKSLGIAASLGNTGSESYADLVRQIYAIWSAFRNRGISYVSIHNSSAPADGPSQHIRPLHEAITERGANCADGSAAFASVLKKLGFDVWLVSPRGHVFVAIHLGSEGGKPEQEWLFVETTALGDVEPEETPAEFAARAAVSAIPENLQGENLGTFLRACFVGEQMATSLRCDWVRLDSVRSLGMRAIPALGSEIGTIPPIPRNIESEREPLRQAKLADRRRTKFVDDRMEVPQCSPYESLAAMQADLESLESDAAALPRLLAAVDGDSSTARRCRLFAAQCRELSPAIEAAIGRFSSLPGIGSATLGVAGSPWQVEVEREGAVAQLTATPIDRQTTPSWIRANEVDSRWYVDPDSLLGDAIEWDRSARIGVGSQGGTKGVSLLAAELKERTEQGAFKTPAQFMAAMESGLNALALSDEQIQELIDRSPVLLGAATQADGVRIRDRKSGTGRKAVDGDQIEVHYVCTLKDGTVIFDSRKQDGNPRRFTAGRATPPGVGQALIGVRVGMIRAAAIPAELAFGAKGAPALKIPPNADLVYEFEVVTVGR